MFKYKHKIKLFFSLKPIDSDIGIAEYRVVWLTMFFWWPLSNLYFNILQSLMTNNMINS
jgi:hypothetical protein